MFVDQACAQQPWTWTWSAWSLSFVFHFAFRHLGCFTSDDSPTTSCTQLPNRRNKRSGRCMQWRLQLGGGVWRQCRHCIATLGIAILDVATVCWWWSWLPKKQLGANPMMGFSQNSWELSARLWVNRHSWVGRHRRVVDIHASAWETIIWCFHVFSIVQCAFNRKKVHCRNRFNIIFPRIGNSCR